MYFQHLHVWCSLKSYPCKCPLIHLGMKISNFSYCFRFTANSTAQSLARIKSYLFSLLSLKRATPTEFKSEIDCLVNSSTGSYKSFTDQMQFCPLRRYFASVTWSFYQLDFELLTSFFFWTLNCFVKARLSACCKYFPTERLLILFCLLFLISRCKKVYRYFLKWLYCLILIFCGMVLNLGQAFGFTSKVEWAFYCFTLWITFLSFAFPRTGLCIQSNLGLKKQIWLCRSLFQYWEGKTQ